MKGDARRERRKRIHTAKKFDKRKKALMQYQLDKDTFFSDKTMDKLLYHVGENKVYQVLNNMALLGRKNFRRLRRRSEVMA